MTSQIEDPFARGLATLRAHRVAIVSDEARRRYLRGLGIQVSVVGIDTELHETTNATTTDEGSPDG